MKKLTIFLWVLCTLPALAQEKSSRFYADIYGSYAFKLGAADVGLGLNEVDQDPPMQRVKPSIAKNRRLSLGRGSRIGLNLGYRFNQNISLELGVYQHWTKVYSIPSLIGLNPVYMDSLRPILKVSGRHKIHARTTNLSLSCVISPNYDKWNPYLKFGIIVNIGSAEVNISESYLIGDYPQLWPVYRIEHSLKGIWGLGFTGAIGVEYKIIPLLSVFAEMNATALNSCLSRGEITQYESTDGLLNINDLPSRQYEYDEGIAATSKRIPFGSWGLSLGVRINF